MARILSYPEYFKAFGSVRGMLGIFFAVSPLAYDHFFSGVIFPPLGDQSEFFKAFFIVAIGLTILLAFRARRASHQSITHYVTYLILAATIFAGGYACARILCVRRIDVVSEKRADYVSIGLCRTDSAKSTFSDASDVDILKARGYTDNDIQENWTPASIAVARLMLFFMFAATSLAVVLVFSLSVLELAKQECADS